MQPKVIGGVSKTWMAMLCIASFAFGMLFTNKAWIGRKDSLYTQSSTNIQSHQVQKSQIMKEPCNHGNKNSKLKNDFLGEVARTHDAIKTLDKAIAKVELELASTRSRSTTALTVKHSNNISTNIATAKAFVVVGINTGFSSRKRRDAIRNTWMPRDLKQLESKKGIVIRFILGHSATPGSILDRAIGSENAQHEDFLILDHVEGYHVLPAKMKAFFSIAVAKWDADFYVKVDDDVHVNLGMLGSVLARHKSKPRVYIGCMKYGPVLSHKYGSKIVVLVFEGLV